MTEQTLRKMIAAGESTRQEFKSWVKCKDYRQRKDLAVKSAVALANTKGGVLPFWIVSIVWESAIWGLRRQMRHLSSWISQSLERPCLIVTGGSGKRFYLKKCYINGNMTMWIVREYIIVLQALGRDCWIKSLSTFGKSKENPNFQSRKIFSAVQSKNTLYICQHLALLIFGIIFTHILDWITE